MSKTKEISLDLRKRAVDVHKAGEGYTKLSKCFNICSEKYYQGEQHIKERDWQSQEVKDFKESEKKTSE